MRHKHKFSALCAILIDRQGKKNVIQKNVVIILLIKNNFHLLLVDQNSIYIAFWRGLSLALAYFIRIIYFIERSTSSVSLTRRCCLSDNRF